MISLYGAGFVGGKFAKMYEPYVEIQGRDERQPISKEILYFISTTHNYHVKDDITKDVDTNLRVLCETLDYCRSQDIVFNFVSSWFVYGHTSNLPAVEHSRCNPTGFYSITKKCAEDLIKSFADLTGMKYRILRLCNVVGHDPNATRQKNALVWMINELKANRDIKLYDNGCHSRDIMHVDDVCRAIWTVMDKGELNEIYNIGSGKPTTVSEIISLANYYIKSRGKIESIDPPQFHKDVQTTSFWLNTNKLKSLGFEQHITNEFIIKDLCL